MGAFPVGYDAAVKAYLANPSGGWNFQGAPTQAQPNLGWGGPPALSQQPGATAYNAQFNAAVPVNQQPRGTQPVSAGGWGFDPYSLMMQQQQGQFPGLASDQFAKATGQPTVPQFQFPTFGAQPASQAAPSMPSTFGPATTSSGIPTSVPASGGAPAFFGAPQASQATQPSAQSSPMLTGAGGGGAGTGALGGPMFTAPSGNPFTAPPIGGQPPNFSQPPGIFPQPQPQAGQPSNVDQALALMPGNLSYLQNIAGGTGAGAPVNATSQWQTMVDAMQRRTQENAAQVAEQFNVGGNRFSSAFGTGMSDYWNQANLQQQGLLAQMQLPAMMQAQQLQVGAGSTFGQFGQQALQQLSSQNFQSQQQQYQAQLQAALAMMGYGSQAAGQLGQIGYGATSQLNQGATQAAMMDPQIQAQLIGLGTQGAGTFNNMMMQNLLGGGQLGIGQYDVGQSQINNAMQQFYQTQPAYNPLLQMMYSAAFNQPTLAYPSYQQGSLGGILGGLGSLAGGVGMLGGLI
jgi:hypothetical protein